MFNKTRTDEPRPKTWTPALLDREGHLTTTAHSTWAWFSLTNTYTDDLTDAGIDGLIMSCADRLADIQGAGEFYVRATTASWPCAEYERRLRDEPIGRHRVDPATMVPGAVTRDDIIESAAWFPVEAVVEEKPGVTRPLDSRWPSVAIGVRIATERIEQCDLLRLVADEPEPANRGKLTETRGLLRDVTAALAGPGFEAYPLDEEGFAWLYDASIALGHDIPQTVPEGRRSPLDGANVSAVQDPDGVTVPVRVEVDGDVETRHVRVLRLALWKERNTATTAPWMQWALSRPYRVDIAARFTIKTNDESIRAVRRAVRKNDGIVKHLDKFGRPVSGRMRAAVRRGPEIIDEMETGTKSTSSQIEGQVVFAVSGATRREAVDVAQQLKSDASVGGGDADEARYGPGLILEGAPAQWAEWLKFIPGEAWTMHGHPQRQSLHMLASGLPHAWARAGDATGVPFGAIAGSTDFYVFDPFGGVRRDKAGVFGVLGDQGSGKSTILAVLAWWVALVDQAPVTLLDPSGRIAEQLAVPELAPHTRVIRLDGRGAPGTLASHFLTPDPQRHLYDDDDAWRDALAAVQIERMETAIDAARSAMPTREMAGDPHVVDAIRSAVTGLGGDYGVQPSDVIAAIAGHSDVGAEVADRIRSYANLSAGRLLWADRDPRATYAKGGEDLLTILSVAGVDAPKNSDPATWSSAESRAVTLLAAAAQLASATVWGSRDPKALLIDEGTTLLAGASAVQSMIQRGALDSRKFTALIGIAMHLAGSLESVGAHADAMFGAAAVMRTEGQNAAAAMRMLRAAGNGRGWEDMVDKFSNGEMILSGWDGRKVHTRFDKAWLPAEFHEQLKTSTAEPVEPLRTLFGQGPR